MASMLRVDRQNWEATVRFTSLAKRLESGKFTEQLFYGVVDAGRKTKTKVQKAVARQMAVKAGVYSSYVVKNTRGIPRRAILAYDIFGVKGGIGVENYRGLRVVKGRSRKADAALPPGIFARGTVRSGVWNNPRIFKRSFENGGFKAMLPGGNGRAPKSLWTFGLKPNQPRDSRGRFGATGIKYGKVRTLYGPSLLKEIPMGNSLETFFDFGPVELERQVAKRLTKILTF